MEHQPGTTYKQHHAAAMSLNKAFSDAAEGDTRGANAVDEKDLLAILWAKFIDTGRAILCTQKNIVSISLPGRMI